VRSDVFSLAATIYTVLAGQTPFAVRGRSNGTLDLIGRIERGAITPLARQDVPRSLVAVLQKGMASDRNDRFATAVDFARALQRVELELGYSPTAIDVPNLLIEAPNRGNDADDADATRARSVATIDAQPAAAMIVPPVFDAPSVGDAPPPNDAPPQSGDSTVVRSPQSIAAQPVDEETVVRRAPVVAETVGPPADTDVPPRGRNRWLVWGGIAAAVLIAGAVTAGILLGGDGEDIAAGPTPGASGDAIVIDTIPTPTVGSVVPGDTTLTVTVVNPDPLEGDEFVWRRYDRPDEASRAIDDGVIVIKDYKPGDSVCLEVSVKRGTKASANALEECFPQ
jgi:hypothetical protein